MINKTTIRKFLGRELDSYDWLKKQSTKALDAAILEMDPQPDFGAIKPWDHQKVCFLILNELKRFLPLLDMGGGKTLLTLLLLKYRKQCGDKIKAIVFVPFITSVETWVDEAAIHTPSLKCVPLLGTTAQNLERLKGEGDLFIMCYQSAVAAVCELVPGRKRGKVKWQLKPEQVRKYFAGFNMFVGDEIHKCKKVTSLTYRMCRAIAAQCEWVLGLTGTPFGKNLEDIWAQFYLVDFGETLGPTLSFYREVYFTLKINHWGGYDYKFDKKLLPTLKKNIKNSSIYYSIDEFHDMPPRKYIIKKLRLPDACQGYVDDAVAKLKDAIGKNSFEGVKSRYLQLRQLSSGFMTLRDESNAKLQLKFDENVKMDALTEILEGMAPTSKIIIFHHFIYTNQLISEHLKSMKIKHARIWSGQRDQIGQLRLFKNDPAYQALVINSKSGSSSLNLQMANYIVFFEQPEDPIDRQQAERRAWRPGQLKRVMIYDLLVKGTGDIGKHKANKSGEDLLKQLLHGKARIE